MSTPINEPFYTVQDLAWMFNVDEKTVRRELNKGRDDLADHGHLFARYARNGRRFCHGA